jgi:hypothetical protein
MSTTHLLEEHGHGGDNDALEHGPGLEQLADGDELQLEDVPGGGLAQVGEELGDGALLEQRLGLDLEELDLDQLVVRRQVAQVRQDPARLVLAAVVDEPTRREGHEDHAHEQDRGRAQLEAGRHEPGGVGLTLAGAADEVSAAGGGGLVSKGEDSC